MSDQSLLLSVYFVLWGVFMAWVWLPILYRVIAGRIRDIRFARRLHRARRTEPMLKT